MKPGERVIWVHSPGRSISSGWRLERIPGVIVGICRRRIRLKVWLGGKERFLSVDPENVYYDEAAATHQTHQDCAGENP